MNALKRLWILGGASLLVLGGAAIPLTVGDGFEDPIHYETPKAEVFRAAFADDGETTAEVKKLVFHYYNTDKKNNTRELYTWMGSFSAKTPFVQDEDDKDGYYYHVELDFTGEYSAYAGQPSLNFIVKTIGTWDGQSQDCEINFDEFKPDANGVVTVWTCPGQKGAIDIFLTKEETKMAKVNKAYFTGWKNIHAIADEKPKTYRLYALDKTYLISTEAVQDRIKESRLIKTGTPTGKEFDITFNYLAHINVQYLLETEYDSHTRTQSIIVASNKLYKDANFVKYYNYSGNDLGVTWTKDQTTFKVWAPTAGAIVLNIYNGGTPKGLGIKAYTAVDQYVMTMQPGGVWEKTLLTPAGTESLDGKYYTYTVYNSEGVNEVCDPYAKACGVNGKRGMILDFSRTNPDKWDTLPLKWDGTARDIKTPQELSIYEVHIRDLTGDKTWISKQNNRNGTFPAFYESGTKYSSAKTGFDHIEEMGVNAVQIMPMYDQDNSELYYYYKDESSESKEQVNVDINNYSGDKSKLHLDYNWGYNPLNYNCIEGSYSSDPIDGAVRVKEFKELVYAYANNKNKTRITMDVVYNHVSSVSKSNFTKLMPLYYFRFDEANDAYWNGSGCSNEVKSEAPMMSKFIVDSLCWWATEYKVKGFRFDLMELIDTDTLNAARKALFNIDPDIYMYGEGWKADASGIEKGKTGASTYSTYDKCKPAANSVVLGCFNDGGRNALKGGNDGGNIGYCRFYWDNGSAAPTTGSGYKDYPLNIGGWAASGASVFVHSWGGGPDKDYKLTDTSKLRIYNGYTNFVLVRMPGTATGIDWDNNWGKSGDLSLGSGTLTFKDWGTIRTPGTNSFMSSGGFEIAVGQMATGYNVNATITQDARQTVNYASCHDNFTLYDQFSWSLGSAPSTETVAGAPSTTSVMKAISATECAIALGNGAAFFLGGDELLRTKIEDDPASSREGDDYVKMYGKFISHNSYRSSIECNSFKWDRKISVKGYTGSAVSNTAWQQIANAINKRKEFTNFTTYSNSTKSGDDVNYWGASGNSVSWNNGSHIMTLNGSGTWTISY